MDLKQENIKITSTESYEWGIKIKDEKGKIFNVSQTKQDGTQTKAFQQLTAYGNNGLGMTVEVAYAEVQNNRNGMSRYVRFFSEAKNEPTIQAEPRNSSSSTYTPKTRPDAIPEATEAFKQKLHQLNTNQQKIIAKIQDLEKRLQGLETLAVDVKGEKAVKFHQSINAKTKEEDIPIVDENDVKLEDIPF